MLNPFQPSVVFHIESVIWFALEIMPDFYMEHYTGLKWIKRDYSLSQILNLSLSKCFWGSFVNRTQNSSENSKPFWRLRFEGWRDIQHSVSMVLDMRFYIWFIMTECDKYYKMQQLFYYKMLQKFITSCGSTDPCLGFTKLNHSVFLWLSCRHYFLYNIKIVKSTCLYY